MRLSPDGVPVLWEPPPLVFGNREEDEEAEATEAVHVEFSARLCSNASDLQPLSPQMGGGMSPDEAQRVVDVAEALELQLEEAVVRATDRSP